MAVTEAEVLDFIATYENDAAAFQEDILGRNLNTDLWTIPTDICNAISRPYSQVAVAACHGSGKTWLAGGLVIWWVAMGGIVVTTAPSGGQVKRLLWGEVHTAYNKSKVPIGGTLNLTELRISPDNYAIGFSTDETVNFQGYHGKVLIIIDEATGVEAGIWEAIQGIRSGGDVRVLAMGNPTEATGEFFKCFTEKRAVWQCFTIDAYNTPNLRGLTESDVMAMDDDELNDNIVPYLPTRRWANECIYTWGLNTPSYNSRVHGQFPMQSTSALLSLTWIQAASQRLYPEQELTGDLVAGVDVAGPGEDMTVLCVRLGPQIVYIETWSDEDPRYEVSNALEPWRRFNIKVNVDVIGIGYNFARYLEDQYYDVVDVNVAERSDNPEKYYNKKAQYYWELRQRMQEGDLSGLSNEAAMAQLSQIHYEERRGQIKIESKEDAKKKRGTKSPDIAEAIMLAYASTDTGAFPWVAPQAVQGGWNTPHTTVKGERYY